MMTTAEIIAFQKRHTDWAGVPLAADGVGGPKTEWALAIAAGGDTRATILREALRYVGVSEEPPGSNKGPLVSLFQAPGGIGDGHPWCCAFVSYVLQQAAVKWGYHLLVREMAQKEKAALRAPLPGDVFYILRDDGTGHCGLVTGVSVWEVMTVEGNCKNAVRVGRRDRSKLSGFLDPCPNEIPFKVAAVNYSVPDLDGAEDR